MPAIWGIYPGIFYRRLIGYCFVAGGWVPKSGRWRDSLAPKVAPLPPGTRSSTAARSSAPAWPPCCSAGCCSRYWSSALRSDPRQDWHSSASRNGPLCHPGGHRPGPPLHPSTARPGL